MPLNRVKGTKMYSIYSLTQKWFYRQYFGSKMSLNYAKGTKMPLYVVWFKNALDFNILVQKCPYCYLMVKKVYFSNKYIITFCLTHFFSINIFKKIKKYLSYFNSQKKIMKILLTYHQYFFYRYININ